MKLNGLFYFAVYELVISLLAVLNGLSHFIILINSILGIIGAVLIFCERKEGFVFSLIWAILQIPIIQLTIFSSGLDLVFNMSQVFSLYFTFYFTISGVKYLLGINFLGVLLLFLLLFLKKKTQKLDKKKKK